ncbi:MarR family winged helix-turn-helix transcriptional regulator [Paenibacillus chitinolyticus]|uniref:MarR family winged helix-turn-helix transcriptional regulator n=1 Tax=Paenibacillus chitinolyticus TaxID=79263 RepID=UPI003865BC4A
MNVNRKPAKEYTTEQQLPRLGTKPYRDLLERTANSDTDRDSALTGLLMLWVGDSVLDVMDIHLSDYDITESKMDILLLIFLHQDQELVTPSSIADRLGIRRSSVTSLLNWLDKRDLIIREPYSKDGRMTHIRLSPEGSGLVQRVLPVFWSTCASLVDELDKEERELFNKMLVKLNRGIEKRLGAGR